MKLYLYLVSLSCCYLLAFGGACLKDSNTAQSASAYNTRLWSYSPASAASVSSSSTLTFMSYNLQSSISAACVSNAGVQAALMTADFVGNQEVVQGVDTRCSKCVMPKIIADATGKSTRFVMTFPWRTGQYGVNAGTSQRILDTKYYLYNTNGEQRALVALKTTPPGLNGKALWFISTHLDYDIPAARQQQATQLVSWVRSNIIAADSQASVVVVGDFNGGSSDAFYGIMKGLFKNSWEVFNGSPNNGFTYPASGPGSRFDHIWYYTPSSVSAWPTSVTVVNTLASDHRPIRASIQFTVASSSTPAPPKASATSAPTTKAPVTSAPTTKAPVTAAPTTKAPATSGGSCSVSLSFDSTSHNLVIRNTGTKDVKTLEITFSPSLPSNSWNWLAGSSSHAYTVPTWAFDSLKVGKSYTNSGYYTSSLPTATVSRISC